jgi:hypothetical protein
MPPYGRARSLSHARRAGAAVALATAFGTSFVQAQGAPEPAAPQEPTPPSTPQPETPPSQGVAPTPPPPGEPPPTTPPPSASEPAPLDARPEEKDFSHGLEFIYFNVEGGYQSVGLRTLHTSNLLPETASTSGGGPFFGLGGGVRLIFLTLGPRFRIGQIDGWNTWTLDAEAGIHLPLGHVEPYFTFAVGYARFSANNADTTVPSADVSIRGFNARLGMGIDYYASKNFTIGANATAEILAMSRSGELPTSPQAQVATCMAVMDPMQKQQCASAAVYSADGSSLGMAGTVGAVVGLHF